MNQYVRTAGLILTCGVIIFAFAGMAQVELNQINRSRSNRDRLDLLEKHQHPMQHNHTVDAMAVQYGRVSTGTPYYLAGIGGWY